MDFSAALVMLKLGSKMRRKSWNENMLVVFQKGYPKGIPCNENTSKAFGIKIGEPFICNPYLQIKLSDGSCSMYNCSSDDILANDWEEK